MSTRYVDNPAWVKMTDKNGNVIAEGPIGSWSMEFGHGAYPKYSCDFIAMEHKPVCSHVWKEYVGFTEKFKYCESCNEKEKL